MGCKWLLMVMRTSILPTKTCIYQFREFIRGGPIYIDKFDYIFKHYCSVARVF